MTKMNQYLVRLQCYQRDVDRMQNLFVCVSAPSPDDIQAPLREMLIKLQPKHGFLGVYVEEIAAVEPSFAFWFHNDDFHTESVDWDVEPAWLQALEVPDTAEENAEHHAWNVEYAAKHGEPAPEWDGKESLGSTILPFMEFEQAPEPKPRGRRKAH